MSNPYYPDDCPSPEHDPVPAALRSGDLFGAVGVAENLRSWADEFRTQQHPVTLTLFRAAQVLEQIDTTLTALRKSIADAEATAAAEYNRRCEAYAAAINDARSSDANWEEKHADYAKGKRDALRAILTLLNAQGQTRSAQRKD